ncbi:MAG: sigma-54 interaction domain-containing protein, partial [Burkholderiaceae bacterium]
MTAQFEHSHPALWLDPKAAVGSAEREQLATAGLQLLPVTTLDDLRQGLAKARLVVIRLMGDVGLLQEVKKLTQSFGHDVPVLCRVDQGELSLGVEAMRRGAYHVLPTNDWSVESWRKALALTPKRSEAVQRQPQTFVFVDPNSQHLLELARRVAQTEVSALVVGPTGAGKEVLARVLHDASPRRNGPFVALNCAALPEHLIEDLLFGHEKGAFTGALKEHRGLFEQAHGGTIFLDEIAEMPYHLQTKLLRVLQERKITRLGGNGSVELDVRLVAATNKDLREAINNREFREDLYFRISAFKLTILPLRERTGDVLPLAMQFLEKFGPPDRQVQLTPTAIERLQGYSWPGNVRELQNVIQRALVLCNDDLITEDALMVDEIEQRPSSQALPLSTQTNLMQYGPREVSEAHQL